MVALYIHIIMYRDSILISMRHVVGTHQDSAGRVSTATGTVIDSTDAEICTQQLYSHNLPAFAMRSSEQ